MTRPDHETIRELRKAHRNALLDSLQAQRDRLSAWMALASIACDNDGSANELRIKARNGMPLSGIEPSNQAIQFATERKEVDRQIAAIEKVIA